MSEALNINGTLTDQSDLERWGAAKCDLGLENWRALLSEELAALSSVREISVSEGSKIREFNNLTAFSESSLLGMIAKKFISQEWSKRVSFDTIYHVIDQPGTIHRNQKFHFDTISCVKLILNLNVEEASATEFIKGSHTFFWPRVSGILFKLSRGRIKLAGKGTEHLYGNEKIVRSDKLNFFTDDGVVFFTNTYHRAGTKVENGRQIIIITLRLH